jgi:hypothetical protein
LAGFLRSTTTLSRSLPEVLVFTTLARGRPVAAQRDIVTRLPVLLGVALGLSGCFYTEEINQRPGISIQSTGNQVYRGDHVVLGSHADDPENHDVKFTWRAYACTEGAGGADCDDVPFYTEVLDDAEFDVPLVRGNPALPMRNVRVLLEGKDELGATAKPVQELVIVTLDRPPAIELARNGTFVMTPTREVIIYATVSDFDDGPEALGTPTWVVFAPAQVPYTLVDEPALSNPNDPAHKTFAKRFTPSAVGDWEIEVTVTDPLGEKTMESLFFTVVPPPPPCIAQVSPIVPPPGLALPITEPTLFRVPVVIDDRDFYPPEPDDPLSVTRFQWSFLAPGGVVHASVPGATGNSFALDPATFTPGDIVEVRVEIFDRQLTPIACPDSDATCSTISMASCIQRQTWRVEVR